MTKTARAPRTSARVVPLRRGATVEMVRLVCPDAAQATRIAESFGLPVLDSDGIRDLHQRLITETADALSAKASTNAPCRSTCNASSAPMSAQRTAPASSTAAPSPKRDEATAKLANDTRDEDLDGPVGFRSAAQRKREFAAEVAVQAHALRMAAEGAAAAYEHVVGESWKPFERQPEQPGETVSRKAAEVQMAAFGWRRRRGFGPASRSRFDVGRSLRDRPFSCRTASRQKRASRNESEWSAIRGPFRLSVDAPAGVAAQRLCRPPLPFGPASLSSAPTTSATGCAAPPAFAADRRDGPR